MDRRKPNYASAIIMVIFGLVLGWAITHWVLEPTLYKETPPEQQQMIQAIEQLSANLQHIKENPESWQDGSNARLLDESIKLTEQLDLQGK